MGASSYTDPEMGSECKRYWFADLMADGWIPADADPSTLLERMSKYGLSMHRNPSWEDAVTSGFCQSNGEYISILRELCIRWSQDEVRQYNSSKEAQLLKLVLILRETDTMISRVSEQITSWQGMLRYMIDLPQLETAGESLSLCQAGGGDDGISLLTRDLVCMRASRSRLAQDIAARAEEIIPNCSALVGPLVASRICSAAGGLTRLARMPASAIQIIGAKNAFFSHRATGSPPPKHGLIFEHKRIHAAPKRLRGRVARTVSANLAIASRIDCYRGLLDREFIERAEVRIEKAGRRS